MNENTKLMTVAFLRTLVGQCDICNRRNSAACADCPASRAKSLILEIQADARPEPEPDYSVAARMAKIEEILRAANHPLLSAEINLSSLCTRQVKFWTLQQMLRMRRVRRGYSKSRKAYLYTLCTKKKP